MSVIVGLDPGPEHSAIVCLNGMTISDSAWLPNCEVLTRLTQTLSVSKVLAIETLHTRAEPVSQQAMDGQLWAGRFIQVAEHWMATVVKVDERDSRFAATGKRASTIADVKMGLLNIYGADQQAPCNVCKASGNVPGVRGPKKCQTCKGRKFVIEPGPLHGLNEHERMALCAALHVQQQRDRRPASA